jgi:heme/copper-type cytochrome/quinol oxidase subunit 2
MHANVIWACVIVAAAVFAVMIYSVATFAGELGDTPAKYRRGPLAEVLWAIVPILIVVALALPAVRPMLTPQARTELAADQAPENGARIKITTQFSTTTALADAYDDGRRD